MFVDDDCIELDGISRHVVMRYRVAVVISGIIIVILLCIFSCYPVFIASGLHSSHWQKPDRARRSSSYVDGRTYSHRYR